MSHSLWYYVTSLQVLNITTHYATSILIEGIAIVDSFIEANRLGLSRDIRRVDLRITVRTNSSTSYQRDKTLHIDSCHG